MRITFHMCIALKSMRARGDNARQMSREFFLARAKSPQPHETTYAKSESA